MYRVIQSAPLTLREAHLVLLIKKAIRKKSAWGEYFTATELADRIRALSGASVAPSELMCLLDMYDVFSRGTGKHPFRRKIADLRGAKHEMQLAVRRTERRKWHLRLG